MREITPEEYVRGVLNRCLENHAERLRDTIAWASQRYACAIEDLTIELSPRGEILRVRPATPDERWLNWHSDNHGGSAI